MPGLTTLFPQLKPYVLERAAYKCRITKTLNLLETSHESREFQNYLDMVNDNLVLVQTVDKKIVDFLVDSMDEVDEQAFSSELEGQAEYVLSVKNKLTAHNPVDAPLGSSARTSVFPDVKLKLPELNCDYFSGEGNNLEFHTFKTQFDNVIGLRTNLSDSTKLTYLKSFLKGYALKLVQHLHITDQNYSIAIELLKNEFLDELAIVDGLFRKFLELKPKQDNSFLETKIFINEVKCVLSDLKVYHRNLLLETSSREFISHIVFARLPVQFKQELVRKINKSYPSLDEIYDNYIDVVKTLNMRQIRSHEERVQPKVPEKIAHLPTLANNSTSSQASNPSEKRRNCKFCNCPGHTMMKCTKYPSHESRIKRCRELKLCFNCSSNKHISKECRANLDFNCSVCGSNKHISPICPQGS